MTDPLNIEVEPVPLEAILGLRDEYRRALNCQIVHDSYHARGFTDSYLLRMQGQIVGYGSVAGDARGPRDVIKEFYVLPAYGAATLLLFDCAVDLASERILFADAFTTNHAVPGVALRPVTDADRASIFPHTREPVGEWGLEVGGEVVATGGLMFHYNPPYGDIYMEVAEPYQRRGYASYLVQELKRLCYEKGCIPVARCHRDNLASRLTLQRAGMRPCACIARGRIVASNRFLS